MVIEYRGGRLAKGLKKHDSATAPCGMFLSPWVCSRCLSRALRTTKWQWPQIRHYAAASEDIFPSPFLVVKQLFLTCS